VSAQPPADPAEPSADARAAGLVESADADLRRFGYEQELHRSVPTVDLII